MESEMLKATLVLVILFAYAVVTTQYLITAYGSLTSAIV
jgi:hypothetical protein